MAADAPFGLYVHVPYCRHRCPYCNFNVWIDRHAPWSDLTDAVINELDARAQAFPGTLRSVYFGGGTPSLAPPRFFERVLKFADATFGLSAAAEITVEIEPDTISEEALRQLYGLGINRASLGWQSTHDVLLRRLGRGHDALAAMEMARRVTASGFESVSVDLMFGVPDQSIEQLEEDIDRLLELESGHVSLYELTIEPDTEFQVRFDRGRLRPPPEEHVLAMMDRIDERLRDAGYRNYEVSSYAKPGYEAVHNSGYWHGAPYLGVGPGAHSFRPGEDIGWRWESLRAPGRFLEIWRKRANGSGAVPEPDTVEWIEELDPRTLLAERFMTAMRLESGIDLRDIDLADNESEVERAFKQGQHLGWIRREGTRLIPTRTGRRHADSLALLFFPR